MALFGRKKQDSVLPDEVSQYYQSQRRERIGVAIILGIVALIVTLLIAVALFFGGRWVYREFIANDNTAPSLEPATEQTDKSAEQSKAQQGSSPSNSQGQSASPSPAPSPTPSTPQTNSGSSSTTTPQTTPNLGDEPSLPHTGDPGM